MAPMKRPAAASAASGKANKKAATDFKRDLNQVQSALTVCETHPKSVVRMVAGALPKAIAPYEADRHSFQQQVVKMASEMMATVQGTIEEQHGLSNAAIGEAESRVANQADVLAAASHAVVAQRAAEKALKMARTAARREEAAAKAAAKQEKKRQKVVEEECNAQQARVAELELQRGVLGNIKQGGEDDPSALLALSRECGVEDELLASAGIALNRPAAERGHFDLLVIGQIEPTLSDRLDAEKQALASKAAAVESGASEVRATEEALESAMSKARSIDEELGCAIVAVGKAQSAELEASTAVQHGVPALEKVKKEATKASKILEQHLKAMDSFMRLARRARPPPTSDEERTRQFEDGEVSPVD